MPPGGYSPNLTLKNCLSFPLGAGTSTVAFTALFVSFTVAPAAGVVAVRVRLFREVHESLERAAVACVYV